MQDTCLPQNYVNCIGKVKVCGCRRFRESVLYGQCLFVLVLVFRFLIFSLSGFPALFHRKSCHVSPFPPFAFCYPSSVVVLSGIVRLSSALFLCFIIFIL